MTKEANKLKEIWRLLAHRQRDKDSITGDVELHITYYHKDKIRRDIDNYGKLVLDAMTGIVYEDDVQITKMIVEKKLDRINPRVEVEVVA